jgi:hypothetical protein
MAGKIFYREMIMIEDEAKKPRFRIVAVSDLNLKVYAPHMRLSELEHIAKETGASLIFLEKGSPERQAGAKRKKDIK